MSKLTNSEQATLERALALAHRHIWTAANLYQCRDEYETADDLGVFSRYLADRLDVELAKGVKLRTRPRNSA